MKNGVGAAPTLLSLFALGLCWAAGAAALQDAEVLPGPVAVWAVIVAEAADGALWEHILATLGRVAAAFTLAMGLGSLVGILLGRSRILEQWLFPWVSVFLNVPALVVIVLCYLWIGLNEVAAIAAVASNKTAMVAVTLREGVRSLDPRLSEMAQIQRMNWSLRVRHVLFPQLWPFVASAMRNGLAVIWKIVLVVEFLGRSNGVGFQIHLYFQLFDTTTVLAYSLSFVAVMLIIEYAVLQPWETRARAWQSRSA